MEEVRIDIRDIDTEWFLGVRVFLDRSRDIFLFPAASIDRLGEHDPDTGAYVLLDGRVIAEPEEVALSGSPVPMWSVTCGQLVTRPAAGRP